MSKQNRRCTSMSCWPCNACMIICWKGMAFAGCCTQSGTHQWGSTKKIQVKHNPGKRLYGGPGQHKIGSAHLGHVGIILFGGPHWTIIEMLTPCYKLGRPHIIGHFSKWPPLKSSENWIAHILAFGQPRNTNLVSKPTFSRSLNPMGML